MAILIPSKNIYHKQNPKVRDNVIERMEVSAVEIVPNNEYETIIHNENIPIYLSGAWQEDVDIYGNTPPSSLEDTYYQRGVFVGVKPYNIENYEIKIPKLGKNKYVSKIYNLTNIEGENYIKTSLRYKKYNGYRNVYLIHKKAPNITTSTIIGDYLPATQNNMNITYDNIIYDENPIEEKIVNLLEDNLTVEETISAVGYSIQLKAKVVGENKTNISTITINDSDENFYKLNVSILIGYEKYYGIQIDELNKSENVFAPQIKYLNEQHTVKLNAEKIIAQNLEISIYGDTIGIDLQDKTIYIPNNDTTSKKVFTVDGNELMQANYRTVEIKGVALVENKDYTVSFVPNEILGNRTIITFLTDRAINSDKTITYAEANSIIVYSGNKSFSLDGDVPINKIETHDKTEKILSLAQDFTKTSNAYKKGKETATIRCSISDYYDGDEKVIAIDNSTGKMSFKMYDQVIPMVYGANGKDRPMSLYQDGSPKVFQVLGAKKFYDGAVWQELSLQEVDKN